MQGPKREKKKLGRRAGRKAVGESVRSSTCWFSEVHVLPSICGSGWMCNIFVSYLFSFLAGCRLQVAGCGLRVAGWRLASSVLALEETSAGLLGGLTVVAAERERLFHFVLFLLEVVTCSGPVGCSSRRCKANGSCPRSKKQEAGVTSGTTTTSGDSLLILRGRSVCL